MRALVIGLCFGIPVAAAAQTPSPVRNVPAGERTLAPPSLTPRLKPRLSPTQIEAKVPAKVREQARTRAAELLAADAGGDPGMRAMAIASEVAPNGDTDAIAYLILQRAQREAEEQVKDAERTDPARLPSLTDRKARIEAAMWAVAKKISDTQ